MSEAGAGETEGGAGGATFIGQVHQEGATPARMVPPPSTWGQTITVPVTKGFLPSGLPGDSEHTHHNPAPLPTARLPRWGGRGVWAASGPQPQRLETGGHTSPRLPPPRGPRAELPGDHCTGGPPLARSRPPARGGGHCAATGGACRLWGQRLGFPQAHGAEPSPPSRASVALQTRDPGQGREAQLDVARCLRPRVCAQGPTRDASSACW